MASANNNYYLAPPPLSANCNEKELSGWGREIIGAGEAYLKMQPAYQYIDEGVRLVNGELFDTNSTNTLSDARTEQTVRNLKELIAAQTNIRIIPSFKTEIGEFEHQKTLLNKSYMAWQSMTFADRKIRKVWQYATAAGTGYAGLRWDPDYWRLGRGDIVIDAYGPTNVMPIGMPHSHELKRAYAVVLKIATPYHEVIRAHPLQADKIKPTGDEKRSGVISEAVKMASAVLRRFAPGAVQEEEPAPWGTVDVYYVYINDVAINETGRTLLMGKPGTSWEYKVPTMKSQILVGKENDKNIYRDAEPDDCRLYPTMRLLKFASGTCLNSDYADQVNPYWAGLPLVQFRADDWPWSFLGFPVTRSGSNLERNNIGLLRGIFDSMNARLSPTRAYDRNTMAEQLASNIDPRIPNQVVGLDFTYGGEQLKPLLPADYYNVPAHFVQLIKDNEERIKHQMGVADATALARARQLPSSDSTEKILEAMGPLIKDQSRSMESEIKDLGMIWKDMFFQWYTLKRRMQLLGDDGKVKEDFEVSVGDLIPSAGIPGQRPGMTHWELARLFAPLISFEVDPYSLHEFNSMTRKLFRIQLMRAGFPQSWWTLADVFDIRNFGPKPKIKDKDTGEEREAETELELWMFQKEIEIRFQAQLQKEAQAAGLGQPGGGEAGAGGGPGRPPTGQNPPALEQKGGGERSTVRESKH
jgi:hypothetical protein